MFTRKITFLKLSFLLILSTALGGCLTLADQTKRAAQFEGFKGAAGNLSKYPNDKTVEKQVRLILEDFAKKKGLSEDRYIEHEYSEYLESSKDSQPSLNSFMFYFDGLSHANERGIVNDQIYSDLKAQFKRQVVDGFIVGSFDGLTTDTRIRSYFPELVTPQSLKSLTNQAIAEINSRQRRHFEHNVEFVTLVDRYGNSADVILVKRFLAGYQVKDEDILILNGTNNFKVDRSKFQSPKLLGDFHISEAARFGVEVKSELRSMVKDFKDPDNVKFRNVAVLATPSKFHICGELNGVNSYGAYVGFKKFISSGAIHQIESEKKHLYSEEIHNDCSLRRFPLDQFNLEQTSA